MTRALIGWPLLPVPQSDGRLLYPSDLDASVRDAIRLILTTRPGEMLLHPEFGAGLDLYLDEPNTLGLRQAIHDRVVESLSRWETRIEVDRVSVSESNDNPSHVRIEIAYRLRRTGVADSLNLTLSAGV